MVLHLVTTRISGAENSRLGLRLRDDELVEELAEPDARPALRVRDHLLRGGLLEVRRDAVLEPVLERRQLLVLVEDADRDRVPPLERILQRLELLRLHLLERVDDGVDAPLLE